METKIKLEIPEMNKISENKKKNRNTNKTKIVKLIKIASGILTYS